MRISIRRALAGVVGFGMLIGLAACSTRPPTDEVWLYYMNGSIDKKEFKECVEPNAKGSWQANNDVFALPTSLRTWNITPDDGGDTKEPITVGSKPDTTGQAGPQMHVFLTTEFYLNTNCDGGKGSPIVQFWEKTGRRYAVSNTDAGFEEKNWIKVLRNTLIPVQRSVLVEASKDFTADELDTNANGAWDKIESAVQAKFTTELRDKVGGDYFCGVTYNRGSKDCPPVRFSITDINYADGALQAKRAEVRAAAEDAKKRLIEAQAKVDESRLLAQTARDPNYMELKRLDTQLKAMEIWREGIEKCASNPNCTVFVGEPGGVTVTRK